MKAKDIWVNVPVKDLDRSIAFFTALGFTFNPQFTDKNATCMSFRPRSCAEDTSASPSPTRTRPPKRCCASACAAVPR